jgi:N-acetylmuramic acid 6-phosphate etherase
MSETSQARSAAYLETGAQFQLGALVTEAGHSITANLSEVAKTDLAAALGLLFQADGDVLKKYQEFVWFGYAEQIAATVAAAVKGGGRIFFTGCGSTGRLSILLDSIWRDFWRAKHRCHQPIAAGHDYEHRTVSVMAGGDFALIRAVEGFEDFMMFGSKQLADQGVSAKDIVFAITEGGETSFVIGTAWAGVAAGAKVYFVCNNPPDILSATVERSREIISDARIEKIYLTTGPMSITGSTRMQAVSIQLCVLVTILEMVAGELSGQKTADVPRLFLTDLEALFGQLAAPEFLAALARLVGVEESVYRAQGKISYFADRFGIEVLSDTTERTPTFGTPPFRKFDDDQATESWSFLFVPDDWTDTAWTNLLHRPPRCLVWSAAEIQALVPPEQVERTEEILHKIGPNELMRYKIGSNGLKFRSRVANDGVIAVLSATELERSRNFILNQLGEARTQRLSTGLIFVGPELPGELVSAAGTTVFVRVPQNVFRLDGVTRLGVKLVMNALSTCTMVRLGRVLGNTMLGVVPGNHKLIDRATRYISQLTQLNYAAANALLFEVIEYVEPRRKLDREYPPVVELAVTRIIKSLTNEAAEKYLARFGCPGGPA